ncbi:MAG: tetratricopeptide repeat protein [Pseudomonadota bacterium]
MNRLCQIILGCIIICILQVPPRPYAADLIINSDMQYDYAMACFESHDFSTAVVEFKRFVYFFPEDDRHYSARFLVGVSLFSLDRLAEAAEVFQRMSSLPGDNPLALEAHIMLGKLYLKQGESALAEAQLRNVLMLTRDPAIQDRVYAALGWIYLEKSQALESGALKSAKSWFGKISPDSQKLFSKSDILDTIHHMENFKDKNPILAGIAGIVPGGGFAYTGRIHDAVVAFFVNTALILASCRSFETDNPILGSIVGIVASGFYSGSIYGGISSAYKYNSAQRRQVIETLKQAVPVAGPDSEPWGRSHGLLLSLRFPF